jgi:hypothetical protein
MSFDGWLDARDSATVEREWATLGAKKVQIGEWSPRTLSVRPEGVALLAASFLGCSPDRFAWFATERYADPKTWPAPTFEVGHQVSRSFLDHELDIRQEDCSEVWAIREAIDGSRGVQHITIDCSWGPMTREGGEGRSMTFVRVFDRSTSRAVSIPLWHPAVWMIGEPFDLVSLDLFAQRTDFKLPWKRYSPDSLRGFLAQLTADLDAHFDTSTTWPGGLTKDEIIDNREYNFRVRKRIYRFESAPFAIELDELLDPDGKEETGWLTVEVSGLPWGHEVSARIDSTKDPVWGVSGWVDLTLPRAQLDATLARLAAIPGIQIG